jgi:hypothetical protein
VGACVGCFVGSVTGTVVAGTVGSLGTVVAGGTVVGGTVVGGTVSTGAVVTGGSSFAMERLSFVPQREQDRCSNPSSLTEGAFTWVHWPKL